MIYLKLRLTGAMKRGYITLKLKNNIDFDIDGCHNDRFFNGKILYKGKYIKNLKYRFLHTWKEFLVWW